ARKMMRVRATFWMVRVLMCGALLTFFAATSDAEVTAYPRVPGDASNVDYVSVRVNGVEVPTVGTAMKVGYAHFAFTGRARVEIETRELLTTFDLSPHRLGLVAAAKGNVLEFELNEPRKLHLRVNDLSRFFLFAEAPEVSPPEVGQPGVFSLAEFDVA